MPLNTTEETPLQSEVKMTEPEKLIAVREGVSSSLSLRP
jgi:hypothetical protein